MEKYLKNAYLTWCHIPGTWIPQRKYDVCFADGRPESIYVFALFCVFCRLIDIDSIDTIKRRNHSHHFGCWSERFDHFVVRYGDDYVSVFVNNHHCCAVSTLTESDQKTSCLESCIVQCICRHRLIYCLCAYGSGYRR